MRNFSDFLILTSFIKALIEARSAFQSQTIRSFVNNTAMDVLYYASPLYRNDIVSSLKDELNGTYKLFMERNSSFDGKVYFIISVLLVSRIFFRINYEVILALCIKRIQFYTTA